MGGFGWGTPAPDRLEGGLRPPSETKRGLSEGERPSALVPF